MNVYNKLTSEKTVGIAQGHFLTLYYDTQFEFSYVPTQTFSLNSSSALFMSSGSYRVEFTSSSPFKECEILRAQSSYEMSWTHSRLLVLKNVKRETKVISTEKNTSKGFVVGKTEKFVDFEDSFFEGICRNENIIAFFVNWTA